MALSGTLLTPGKVFSAIAVIAILNNAVKMVPDIITNYMNMIVSLERIQNYLQSREITGYLRSDMNHDLAIDLNSASFS